MGSLIYDQFGIIQNLQISPISQTNCFVIKLNSGQKHVTFFICSFQPQLPQSDCSRKGTRKSCTAYCRARHSHPLKIISFDNSTISRHLNNFFPQQSLIKNFTILFSNFHEFLSIVVNTSIENFLQFSITVQQFIDLKI